MIENLLVDKKNESSLATILVEYASLKQKLEDTENHSWYFNKGIESYEERLSELTDDYEDIRELFNEAPIDFYIHKINENKRKISNYEKCDMNAITYIAHSALSNENEFFTELIRLKSKINLLMPLDYYLENPEKFLTFIS